MSYLLGCIPACAGRAELDFQSSGWNAHALRDAGLPDLLQSSSSSMSDEFKTWLQLHDVGKPYLYIKHQTSGLYSAACAQTNCVAVC
jgi:hypothetical protein